MPGPLHFAAPVVRRVLGPVFRPLTRTLAAVVAIPAFRWFLRVVLRIQQLDDETEKDLVEWFRGSVVLLLATRNFENIIVQLFDPTKGEIELMNGGSLDWFVLGGRLLLAIAVIESMPDQQLFAIIHPGPPKPTYDRSQTLRENVAQQWRPILRGVLCQHLNRSSPVLAIMAAVLKGTAGWVCFVLAIIQYLIIGLVTSRDRAIDVLSTFDEKVREKRDQIIEEFHIRPETTAAPIPDYLVEPHRLRTEPVDTV